MKKIICKFPDGKARIVTPVRNTRGDEHMSDDEILKRAMDKLPPGAEFVRLAEESEIPSDRADRDAWVVNGGGSIAVDAVLKASLPDSSKSL